ncbi:MAG: serine/threonine-protein phosphatase [Eubacteriales bacterium]|nr:serine/threonine-protein phosphatase [Eubacteriales bacterium]
MEVIVSYCTDAGNRKKTNQDSLSVKVVNSPKGKIVFAVVCDGMGGLAHGEMASREVVMAFVEWFEVEFARLVAQDMVSEDTVHDQWQEVIVRTNESLGEYANREGTMMGSTVSVLLLYQEEYYICHVGDSRIYRINEKTKQLTNDQTLVAWEVEMGKLTEEEAKVDPRRSVLLQCVGASEEVRPQYERGKITGNTTFVLSSDGFVHKITKEELQDMFSPERIQDKQHLTQICETAVDIVMERGELDNVTVVAIALKK